jgi:tetratricopeptide (TPR) repeat protein
VVKLSIGLLGGVLAINVLFAADKAVSQTKTPPVTSTNANDSLETEYQKLMAADNAAQAEVDKWITDNEEFKAKGAGVGDQELNQRIMGRLEPIRKGYEDFIRRHPDHVKARIAYGSFLGDLHEEDAAQTQLEKALELNARDPAVYNTLANIYGHTGPVKKAFEFYAKAIALNPREPVYYHNFGTTVYLFRMDAKEFYGITEQQVFDKALQLYSNAMKFDPANFPLASDVAQTYYGIRPERTEEALKAWTNALSIANDEIEREGVYLHFARLKLHAGRFAEAHAHLNAVTNEMYTTLKTRLTRNLDEAEHPSRKTNAPPEGAASQP